MEIIRNPRSELRTLQVLFNFEGPEKGNLQRRDKDGGIAQLGERLLCKQEVSGSIPLISTKGKGRRT